MRIGLIGIGTEVGMLYPLHKANPDKRFFPAFENAVCRNMKKTSLRDVYLTLKEERNEMKLPEEVRKNAERAISRMLEMS